MNNKFKIFLIFFVIVIVIGMSLDAYAISLEYVLEFEVGGEEEFPFYIDSNSNNFIHVLTNRKTIYKFNKDGELLDSWHLDKEKFSSSLNMKIEGTNSYYLADKNNKKISIFKDKNEILTIKSSKFSWVDAIAVDSKNYYIYIADNSKIYKCNYEGDIIKTFGDLWQPGNMVIDNNGDLVVTDANHHRIKKFTSDGESKWIFGQEGTKNGEFKNPFGLAIDKENNIYISESSPFSPHENHRIQIISSTGDFLIKYGKKGQEKGEFNIPGGIEITNEKNKEYLYVVDIANKRVQKFLIKYK